MVWIFHTVPHPGEFGYDTWPKEAWKYLGGTNDWGGMTIDENQKPRDFTRLPYLSRRIGNLAVSGL
jgi:hypothetical protein